MKAVVWHDGAKIGVDEAADPVLADTADAIVRITTSAICGTDLRFARGDMAGMQLGSIFGADGVAEESSPQVRNSKPGDRVVIPSTTGRGRGACCRAG